MKKWTNSRAAQVRISTTASGHPNKRESVGYVVLRKVYRMKMYPNDWRVRLTTAVVIGVCMAAAMILGPVVGIHGFWPVMLSVIVGILLGNLVVGPLFFRRLSGDPTDHPARD
jgi:hypothetical protein